MIHAFIGLMTVAGVVVFGVLIISSIQYTSLEPFIPLVAVAVCAGAVILFLGGLQSSPTKSDINKFLTKEHPSCFYSLQELETSWINSRREFTALLTCSSEGKEASQLVLSVTCGAKLGKAVVCSENAAGKDILNSAKTTFLEFLTETGKEIKNEQRLY